MRIAVKTRDNYLFQKIYLILSEEHTVLRTEDGAEIFDLLITDGGESPKVGVITMGRTDEAMLRIPFTESELRTALPTGKSEESLLTLGDKCVFLRGIKIPLTELELALLSELYHAKGEFISREALLGSVWGVGCTDGILNVYIHYLREKLESGGEKIILSSRKHGYKIDGRYL